MLVRVSLPIWIDTIPSSLAGTESRSLPSSHTLGRDICRPIIPHCSTILPKEIGMCSQCGRTRIHVPRVRLACWRTPKPWMWTSPRVHLSYLRDTLDPNLSLGHPRGILKVSPGNSQGITPPPLPVSQDQSLFRIIIAHLQMIPWLPKKVRMTLHFMRRIAYSSECVCLLSPAFAYLSAGLRLTTYTR